MDRHASQRTRRSQLLVAALGLLLGVALGAALSAALRTDAAEEQPTAAYLDVEYDYLGAIETWPAEPEAQERDPFAGEVSDAELVSAGRTVCTRAGDPGMTFEGMMNLLDFDPHETYVVMAEAADKLCPSQAEAIEAHFD
jgi:hypothetical protein